MVVDRRQEHPKHMVQWKVEVSALFPMVGSEVCCWLYALIRVITSQRKKVEVDGTVWSSTDKADGGNGNN
jgi:hypothetical protein